MEVPVEDAFGAAASGSLRCVHESQVLPQIELTNARGEVRTLVLTADKVVLGSAADADLRVKAAGVLPRHLRFVQTSFGHRVEPVRAGATVEVNGEELFCKDLEPGDVITVGDLELRWLATASPRAAALRAAEPVAAPRPTRRAGARRVPARGARNWLAISAVFLVVVGAAAIGLRSCASSTWPHSPQHYVDLARAQLGNNQPQRALDTLDFALRDATGATRDEALQLRADIEQAQRERAEQPKIEAARGEHDLLLGFETRYLRDGATRPAARELVRLVDRWLAAHREFCARHSQGDSLLRAAEELRARYVAVAALDQPDSAADVVFAARSKLRFQWREYPAAVGMLDAWLQRQDDAQVRRERDAIVSEGEEWLRVKLRSVDVLLERGDRRNAGLDLDQLERWSLLPQWRPQVEERRRRLGGG